MKTETNDALVVAAFGVAAVLLGVILYSGKKAIDSSLKSTAVKSGKVYAVAYEVPEGMSESQALALLSFVAAWGTPLTVPSFARGKVALRVRAVTDLPAGVPDIPSPAGNLTVATVFTVSDE